MASTNKTENYELNQWVKTDPVLMDDFNSDNQKIDKAIKAVADSIPKIETGSYVGSGSYGSASKNTLTFGFVPRLVCIDGHSFARGQEEIYTGSGSCYFTWSGKTLSWYSPQGVIAQMNSDAATYYYWAME